MRWRLAAGGLAGALTLGLFLSVGGAVGQEPAPSNTSRSLVIGTKEAAPFAMRSADGAWQGISIDLWHQVADRLHLTYEFRDLSNVPALLAATQSGAIDVGVAALSVTAERRQTVDFTQPFYTAGLGVATAGGEPSWLPLLRAFFSFGFLQAVLSLLGIALAVGLLVWVFERRDNEHFSGHPARGVLSGIWWSAVAMTQAGAADKAPISLPGRVLAIVWMIASIIALAVFTAGITSALTTHKLQGLVRDVDDLRSLRVGVLDGSSTIEFCRRQRVPHQNFTDVASGLRAVQEGRIDAFLYDRPLLTWTVHRDFPALRVLGVSFDLQNYAFALPLDGPLRHSLDVTMLEVLASPAWQETIFRYVGDAGATPASVE